MKIPPAAPTAPHPVTGARLAVVLGAKVGASGTGSPALRRRASHAAQLYLAGAVEGVIVSGGGTPTSEAEVMAEICAAAGVPRSAIWSEPQARTTADNLRLSAVIARRLGASDLVLVTDRWHMRRALLAARRLGIKARSSAPEGPKPRLPRALRERLAHAKYWLTLWP